MIVVLHGGADDDGVTQIVNNDDFCYSDSGNHEWILRVNRLTNETNYQVLGGDSRTEQMKIDNKTRMFLLPWT